MIKKKLQCIGCGKIIAAERDMIREGVLQVAWDWGYFSGKDGETHSFCLCESCYDRITESFVIPVSVKDTLFFDCLPEAETE